MQFVWEHNGNDTLLYSQDFVGAFTRGNDLPQAMDKVHKEMKAYSLWSDIALPESIEIEIVQEKDSSLNICDADSDVIFDSEKEPLTLEEYQRLKALALRSARDFYELYSSIPDKDKSTNPLRRTFYGNVPRTAQEMYDHTKNVNAYYFGEIDIDADNEGTIYECRERGFAKLEEKPGFLLNPVISGSYDELWSLRKLLRRFLWHDRIHAKAMYRMAVKTFGPEGIADPFHLDTL